MKTTVTPDSPHPARRIGRVLCGLAVLGSSLADARMPVEPWRREARIEIRNTPEQPGIFGTIPASVGADFVIPRATTKELAEYQRARGAPAAARWLCDTYTVAPSSPPEAASLRGLVNAAAAQGDDGMAAANALVCPSLQERVRRTITVRSDGCIFPLDFGPLGHTECHITRYKVMVHQLAVKSCDTTDEERQALDSAACERVLLGRSGRATALRFFTRRAARKHDCLRLGLVGVSPNGAVNLFARAPGCE